MPLSLRTQRVDVFRLSTTTVKGRSTSTYTQVSSGESDHAFAGRVEAASAREAQIAQMQQHVIDVTALFGPEVIDALMVNGKLSTDGVIRHGGRVYKMVGARGPAGPEQEWVVQAVHASGDVVNSLVEIDPAEPPVLTSFVITPALGLEVGGTRQYSVAGRDQYGNPIGFSGGAWSTSNPARATIAAGGLATGVGAGAVNIVYTLGSVVGTLPINVTLTLFAIDVTPEDPTIEEGATQQFTAAGRNVHGVNVPLVGVVWASDDLAAVTIDAGSGLATAIAEGDAVISATVGAIVGTSTATVEAAGGGGPDMVSTFTGANGTNIHGHVCDTGQQWTVHSGAFSIQGNRARNTAGANGWASVPVPSADGRYEIDIHGSSFGAGNGPIVRATDHQNHILVMPASANNSSIYRVQGGAYTLIASGSGTWDNFVNRVGFTLAGNSIDVDLNGVPEASFTEPFNASQARMGWGGNTAGMEADNAEFTA